MTEGEYPTSPDALKREARDPFREKSRQALEVQLRGAKLPSSGSPYIKNGRVDPDDFTTVVSRLYRWHDPPMAVMFAGEARNVPNRRAHYQRLEALCESRGWRFVVLLDESQILHPGAEALGVATTVPAADRYRDLSEFV